MVFTRDVLLDSITLTNLVLIISFLILSSLDKLPNLRRLILLLIAIFHILYIHRYAEYYNLTIAYKPFIVVLYNEKSASAVLDISQIIIVYMLSSYLYYIYKKRYGEK